jgi:hypothetical protein
MQCGQNWIGNNSPSNKTGRCSGASYSASRYRPATKSRSPPTRSASAQCLIGGRASCCILSPHLLRDRAIGIGGSLATSPLPHHRTYGSVSGGSVDYVMCRAATEAKPSEPKKAFGSAMVSAGLFASRHGPCGLPAVFAARSRPTPRRRSSAKRVRPRFHCFQAMARNRRLVHSSSARNADGVWQKPK